jgi:hypothetical protein
VTTLFFEFAQHRVGADTQHWCGIADTATIKRHIDELFFDLESTPFVNGIAHVQGVTATSWYFSANLEPEGCCLKII